MSNFPTTLDDATSLPNPTGTSKQNNPDHAGLHTSENAAIIAAETKIGTGSSTPANNTLLVGTGAGSSAWSQITSSQLAAILSDETGTGKSVFATSPSITTGLNDTNGKTWLGQSATANAVNYPSIANAATGNAPLIQAAGSDSNIGLHIAGKGTSSPHFFGYYDGWINPNETPSYFSNDSTNKTGIMSVADATKFSVGNRIKYVQSGVTNYAIVQARDTVNNRITFNYGTDYAFSNVAISGFYFSREKSPDGFSLDSTKWTVSTTYTSSTLPTNNGSYQQQNSVGLTMPIGVWRASHQGCLEVLKASTTDVGLDCALSSSTSSVSDPELKVHLESLGASSASGNGNLAPFYAEKTISVSVATPYYLIVNAASGVTGGVRGDAAEYIARFINAYL